MTDAYMPDSYKKGCLAADYQRITNELTANGTKIVWTDRGPENEYGMSLSYAYLYPSIITFTPDIMDKIMVKSKKKYVATIVSSETAQ